MTVPVQPFCFVLFEATLLGGDSDRDKETTNHPTPHTLSKPIYHCTVMGLFKLNV